MHGSPNAGVDGLAPLVLKTRSRNKRKPSSVVSSTSQTHPLVEITNDESSMVPTAQPLVSVVVVEAEVEVGARDLPLRSMFSSTRNEVSVLPAEGVKGEGMTEIPPFYHMGAVAT